MTLVVPSDDGQACFLWLDKMLQIILLETSVSGVTVELRREQEVVRGVLQHNCIAHDSDRPTIWDACVCRIDASNSELDVYTEV